MTIIIIVGGLVVLLFAAIGALLHCWRLHSYRIEHWVGDPGQQMCQDTWIVNAHSHAQALYKKCPRKWKVIANGSSAEALSPANPELFERYTSEQYY